MSPIQTIACASLRPARYLGLRDLGGIAPGYRADFAVMNDLAAFPPREVFVGGERVATDGKFIARAAPATPALSIATMPGPFTREDFAWQSGEWRVTSGVTTPDTRHASHEVVANAVAIKSGVTSLTDLEHVPVRVENGYPRLDDTCALVAVIARNRSSQSVGIVKDFGLRAGAVASSFAHDSHNLLVVGRDAAEMATAANAVREMGGGVAVVREDAVIAALRLPVLGLLSDAPLDDIVRDFDAMEDALRALGVQHQRPFLMLSLLSLSVSPKFKFTDKGVIDTERRQLLPAWE